MGISLNRNTEALKQALQKKIEEKGCTGVSVCIRGPEGVLFENGFGKRSVRNDLPVLPDTVFGKYPNLGHAGLVLLKPELFAEKIRGLKG